MGGRSTASPARARWTRSFLFIAICLTPFVARSEKQEELLLASRFSLSNDTTPLDAGQSRLDSDPGLLRAYAHTVGRGSMPRRPPLRTAQRRGTSPTPYGTPRF